VTVHLSFTSDARQSAEDVNRLTAQFNKLTTGVRQYRTQVADLRRAQADLNQRLRQAPVAARGATLAHKNLALQAKQLTAQQKLLAASTSMTTKAMSAGVTAANRLAASYQRLVAAAAAAGSGTGGSAALGALGGAAGGFGGLASAGGAFMLGRYAMQGEQATVGVERMLARDAAGAADAMEQFNRVARNTPHALEAVSAAIFNTKTLLDFYGDDLGDVVQAQAQFATVTGQNFTAMNQLISQTFKAFETDDAEDAIRQLDTILGLVQEYRLNVPALLASLGRTGSTFRALGFDLAETANFMAQITQFGVNVEQINEPIRQMVVNMSKLGLDPREGLIQAVEAIKNAQTDAEAFRLGSEIFGTEGGHVFVDMIRVQAIPALLDLEAQILDGNIPSIEKLYEETKTAGEEFDTLRNKIKLQATEGITPLMKDSISFFERISGMFDDIRLALPGGVNPLDPNPVQDSAADTLLDSLREGRAAAEASADAAKASATASGAMLDTILEAMAATRNTQQILEYMDRAGAAGPFAPGIGSITFEEQIRRANFARGAGIGGNLPFTGPTALATGGGAIGQAAQTALEARARGSQTFFGPGSAGPIGTDTAFSQLPLRDATAHFQAKTLEVLEEIRDKDQEMNIYLDGNLLDRVAVGPIAGRARGTC